MNAALYPNPPGNPVQGILPMHAHRSVDLPQLAPIAFGGEREGAKPKTKWVTVKRTFNPNTFREQYGDYEFDKIYSDSGELTKGQEFCTWLIQLYQKRTRFNDGALIEFGPFKFGGPGKNVSDGCIYKKQNKLSCSEFTLIAIHKLGVNRGILAGARRLYLGCSVLNFRKKYNDPPYDYEVKVPIEEANIQAAANSGENLSVAA